VKHVGSDRPAVRIEVEDERAWCGEQLLDLTPKVFAILRHFVEHPERLLTKDELLDAVWGDTAVSEAALTSCIRDLRRALADTSHAPRYIETVHRRGFRFIGPIAPSHGVPTARSNEVVQSQALVGRDAEMARLHALFETASGGRRRLVFVTGEAGIGKTTLLDTFLARLDAGDEVRIGRGQCVEQYGTGEAYLPVLEALARMAREPRGDAIVRALRQYAPTWLAQLPALLADEDLEPVRRRTQGTTRDRMLRELAEALDVVSVDVPLILVLEDLHWSDSATVDLLAMLARRRDPARVLILATYRPADLAVGPHPLKPVKQDLQAHGDCDEIALEFLSEPAVGHYLAGRFPSASLAPDLTRFLHRNTSGNPLFLVNVVDHLIAHGHVRDVDGRWELSGPIDDIASDVPDTLWQLVDKQIDRLTSQEQAILAVASVAGAEFSAALATADGMDADATEACCAAMARRGQFIRAIGASEWPDGTIAGRYAFIHTLYRKVLYARVSIGRQVGLHLRIGARLERAHGRQAAEIAGELAMHFEQGRDFERAVQYRRQAADNALRHHGYREATDHASRGLELLQAIPESPTPERTREELSLRMALGTALLVTKGYGASDVEQAFARAHELCRRMDDTPELGFALAGLFRFFFVRARFDTARDLAQQVFRLAETRDPSLLAVAHGLVGLPLVATGDYLAARTHLAQGAALYDFERHATIAPQHGDDPGLISLAFLAVTEWFLGYPDQALERSRQGLALAERLAMPFSVAFATTFAAWVHVRRGEASSALARSEAAIALTSEQGFGFLLAEANIFRGWALAELGNVDSGIEQMHRGLDLHRAGGARNGRAAHLALLAEAHGKAKRPEEGLRIVAEGLADVAETGERSYEAELHRIEGELWHEISQHSRRSPATQEKTEASIRRAIAISREQAAKSLELRATIALCRIRPTRSVRAQLGELHGWFTEGFDTADLKASRALLDARA
jgi:DNA-binding winged helix-turn-helix (wHTH) protein/predicted ATPase